MGGNQAEYDIAIIGTGLRAYRRLSTQEYATRALYFSEMPTSAQRSNARI